MREVLDNEVSQIEHIGIRRLVLQCLENAPSYFWEVPSSSTGKYHPKDEFCAGGLVLHTKRTFYVSEELCRALSIKGVERDCVLAAAIMHDLCKQGFPKDEGYTVDGHGYLWSQLLRMSYTKQEILSMPFIQTISRLILYHMGQYDLPYILDWDDKLATIVHLSDYIASRDNILVKVDEKE